MAVADRQCGTRAERKKRTARDGQPASSSRPVYPYAPDRSRQQRGAGSVRFVTSAPPGTLLPVAISRTRRGCIGRDPSRRLETKRTHRLARLLRAGASRAERPAPNHLVQIMGGGDARQAELERRWRCPAHCCVEMRGSGCREWERAAQLAVQASPPAYLLLLLLNQLACQWRQSEREETGACICLSTPLFPEHPVSRHVASRRKPATQMLLLLAASTTTATTGTREKASTTTPLTTCHTIHHP